MISSYITQHIISTKYLHIFILRIALKQAIIFMQNRVYVKGHISEFVFYFTLHLHEQKCDNGRKYTCIRYYFFVRGLHYFIIILRMDSYAT